MSPHLILKQKEAVAEMQRPFAFRIFPHWKCVGLVSLWFFCTFSGSEIARMAVFCGRHSSFGDILAHFQDDKISLNVLSCEMLLHLSIFRRESPAQDTASRDTGRHFMALDAKRFHTVPNGRSGFHSSMLHPAAPSLTFGPLAKWPASWFNAGTQRTTQTDQQEKRCIA